MNLNQFDWKQTKCTQNWPLYGDTSAQIHCAPYPPTSRATLKHKRRQRGFSRHHSEAVNEMCSMLHLSNIFHWATQSRGYQSDVNDANSAWKVRVIGWLKERHWKDEPMHAHFCYSCTVDAEPVGRASAGTSPVYRDVQGYIPCALLYSRVQHSRAGVHSTVRYCAVL